MRPTNNPNVLAGRQRAYLRVQPHFSMQR